MADGLDPFVAIVRAHGMQFGLWFEPEMVNPDSDLARAHPDWVLAPREGAGATARNQQVLDIANPDAYHLVLERISALVAEYDIDYLKWDHNRDLMEPVAHRNGGDRPLVHAQTVALYRMLDELRGAASAAGGRDLLGRRRARRPRHPGAHRPGVGLGLQRSRRARPHRALDAHAGAAGAHRLAPGLAPLPHHVA